MLSSNYSEIEHLMILGNLGASYLYQQNYDKYEELALLILTNQELFYSTIRF